MADDDDAAAEGRLRHRSPGMGGISALPEHLQHEVFSRVGDVTSLFRFAATCHGWLRCFTDRAFLRELCPGSLGEGSGHRAIVQARMTTMAAPPQRASSSPMAPVFFPAPGSPLGPAGRVLTSFAASGSGDDGTFNYAELLAARRGIMLVWLAPRTPDEMDCQLFGVCNPVCGDRPRVLRPLECILAGKKLVSYAIITAADDSSGNGRVARFTFSQLLVITQDRVVREYLHSYSKDRRRWSKPTTCRCFSLVGDRSAIVHRGAAHWLFFDHCHNKRAAGGDSDEHQLYRLSVEVSTANVFLTRLPVRVGGKQLLCVTGDGKLAVASVYPGHVTVWTQPGSAGDNNGDSSTPAATVAWFSTSFRIPAAVPYPHLAPQWQNHERWCNFNHGSLLAVFRGSDVFILDLDTKVMQKVLIVDFDNEAMALVARAKPCLSCVSYEMDLVEFFTLPLGGTRERLGSTTISETESA